MVQAGLVKMTFAETYIGEFWKQIFPKLTLHPDIVIRTGGDIGWMIRKNSPLLMTELNALIVRLEKSGQKNELLARYLKSTKWVKSATSKGELERFDRTMNLFRKYGEKYDVEHLLLMAQGYQESELNQAARSPRARSHHADHAGDRQRDEGRRHPPDRAEHPRGVKFLRAMMNEYHANEPMDPLNKGLFTFAAYNAGHGSREAAAQARRPAGLNPNVWFNNVELMAAEKIGRDGDLRRQHLQVLSRVPAHRKRSAPHASRPKRPSSRATDLMGPQRRWQCGSDSASPRPRSWSTSTAAGFSSS